MKKYIITVSSELKALKINRMIENRSQWDIEPIFDGYPLHAGINYTSEPMVYECANEYAKNHKGVRAKSIWFMLTNHIMKTGKVLLLYVKKKRINSTFSLKPAPQRWPLIWLTE